MELVVGPVAHGGFCVARHEGRVVFVRHALPGERVRVVVTEDRAGSYCRADAVAVLDGAAGPGGPAVSGRGSRRLRRPRLPAPRSGGAAGGPSGRGGPAA